MNYDDDKKWKLTVVAILQRLEDRPVLMRLRDLLNYALSRRQFPMHWQILKMRRGISDKLRSLLLAFSREAQLTIRPISGPG